MSVALRLPRLVPAAKPTLLDERLLRLYVADRRATHDGCLWLNAAFAARPASTCKSRLLVTAKVSGG